MAISSSSASMATAAEEDAATQEETGGAGAGAGELRDDASSAGVWARLMAITEGMPSIGLAEKDVRVGRGDTGGDKRVSKVHCRIWREESGAAFIQDQSLNGTLVKGVRVEKDKSTELQHGDVVVLGSCPAGFPVYVYQVVVDGHRRKRERDEGAKEVEAEEEGSKKLRLMDGVDTVKCSICWNVWHDTVSVAPCLHSFCNSCFSDWYRRSISYHSVCKCPQCRVRVVSVGRNHTLCSLVEIILKENPVLRRSPADVAKMDKNGVVKSDILRLADPEMHSDGDTQSEDVEVSTCRQCGNQGQEVWLPSNASSFRCSPSVTHLSCVACAQLMPSRPDLDVPQKCSTCHQVYCDAYWRSQNFPAGPGVEAGCPASVKLLPVGDWDVADVPANAHRGNEIEKDITRRCLAQHHTSLQVVIREWLDKFESGEADLPRFQEGSPNPPATFTSTSPICSKCEDVLVDHILLSFRQSIPRSVPETAGRQDCWYGHACRTQFNNVAHAWKYNHVCEPTYHLRPHLHEATMPPAT